MSEPKDPVRLSEGGSDATPALRALLRAGREDLPSPAALHALRALLPAGSGGPGGSGEGGGGHAGRGEATRGSGQGPEAEGARDAGPDGGDHPTADRGPDVADTGDPGDSGAGATDLRGGGPGETGAPGAGSAPELTVGPTNAVGAPAAGGLAASTVAGWLVAIVSVVLLVVGLVQDGRVAPVPSSSPPPAPTAPAAAPSDERAATATPGADAGAEPRATPTQRTDATNVHASGRTARPEPQVGTSSTDTPREASVEPTPPKPTEPPPDPQSDLEAELALVRAAQGALARDAARALNLATTHLERFPDGQLAQEREVVAIQALVALGRRTEARTRADAFAARWPASPHLRRITVVLGG